MSFWDRFSASEKMTVEDFVFGDSFTTITINLPPVTSETLLKIPAAYDAINALVRPIKTLPLMFFEKEKISGKNGQTRYVKNRIDDHPIAKMLKAANGWQDRLEFLEYITRDLVTHHNAYAEIVQIGRDDFQLWPISALNVDVYFKNGVVWYRVHETNGGYREIPAVRMWHMKVGPFDEKGIAGRGPLLTTQEALQSALAVIEYGGRFFGNDASPSGGYWQHPNSVSKPSRDTLAASLRYVFGGKNRHKTTVVEEGLEYKTINMPNNKAQFIETKKMDAIEIARIWDVPAHKIKSLDAATFSNIEQQGIEFVVYSLAPWLSAIETSIKTHLIGLDNQIFAEFNVLGLLRGDIAARYAAYAIGRQWGWLSADDIRSLENMNPLPDGTGEMYLTPLNMGDVAANAENN